MSTVNSRSAMHLIPGRIGMSVLSMLESISPGLPHQSPRPFIQQSRGNKCDRIGHLYSNMGVIQGHVSGKAFMTARCRHCGIVEVLIPVRPAETILHPRATKKSRQHWLKTHWIGDLLYHNGQPIEHRHTGPIGKKAA